MERSYNISNPIQSKSHSHYHHTMTTRAARVVIPPSVVRHHNEDVWWTLSFRRWHYSINNTNSIIINSNNSSFSRRYSHIVINNSRSIIIVRIFHCRCYNNTNNTRLKEKSWSSNNVINSYYFLRQSNCTNNSNSIRTFTIKIARTTTQCNNAVTMITRTMARNVMYLRRLHVVIALRLEHVVVAKSARRSKRMMITTTSRQRLLRRMLRNSEQHRFRFSFKPWVIWTILVS